MPSRAKNYYNILAKTTIFIGQYNHYQWQHSPTSVMLYQPKTKWSILKLKCTRALIDLCTERGHELSLLPKMSAFGGCAFTQGVLFLVQLLSFILWWYDFNISQHDRWKHGTHFRFVLITLSGKTPVFHADMTIQYNTIIDLYSAF